MNRLFLFTALAAVVLSSSTIAGPVDLSRLARESSSLLARLTSGGAGDTARVVAVVDGDTIDVDRAGSVLRVRLIGVDTPETKKPGAPVGCFGHAAARRTRRLLAGRRVRLVYDVERHDRYDRTLAYVEADGSDVGAQLLSGGYARARRFPPNLARALRYADLEHAARVDGRGLWGSCR